MCQGKAGPLGMAENDELIKVPNGSDVGSDFMILWD